MDYAALKSELQNDPNILGYASALTSGADSTLAALINAVSANININRDTVGNYEVVNAIVASELAALTSLQIAQLQIVLTPDVLYVNNTNVRTTLGNIFASGTATRTALLALQTRKGSRAEQLFGSGTVVTIDDIATALRKT